MSAFRIASFGEAMIELNFDRKGEQIGFAGDTLNTAIYLTRNLSRQNSVEFVTVLGQDEASNRMLRFIETEDVGFANVSRHPSRLPGVYAIAVDGAGERSFSYWRDQSAARTLFEDGFDQLGGFDLIYFSGISLAILPQDIRTKLLAHLKSHPAQIAFDSNYRPRLWESADVAREMMEAAWRIADVALPSADDEMALFGDESPEAVVDRLKGFGVTNGALKRGADGPLPLGPCGPLPNFSKAPKVIDTTAAGDSFNGAFLAAHVGGASLEESMRRGHEQAIEVIGKLGAIIPRD